MSLLKSPQAREKLFSCSESYVFQLPEKTFFSFPSARWKLCIMDIDFFDVTGAGVGTAVETVDTDDSGRSSVVREMFRSFSVEPMVSQCTTMTPHVTAKYINKTYLGRDASNVPSAIQHTRHSQPNWMALSA